MAKKNKSRGPLAKAVTTILIVVPLLGTLVGILAYFNIAPPDEPSASNTVSVAAIWPFVRGCDGATAVGISSPIDLPASGGTGWPTKDQLAAMDGSGAYALGHLYLVLSSSTSREYTVLGLALDVTDSTESLAIAVEPGSGGCGGETMRVFLADLDQQTVVDQGVIVEGDESGKTVTEPLGDTFTVGPGNSRTIRIDARACKGDYDFQIVLKYVVEGEDVVREERVGPYRVFGGAGAGTGTLYQTDPYGTDGWIEVPRMSQDYICTHA